MKLQKVTLIAVLAFALMNVSALACATCAPCKATADKSAKVEAKGIDTKALAAKIKAEKDLVILDARSGKYDDGKRIPGAKQLASSADAKTIAEIAGADKNAKIITYCSNLKCKASSKLAAKLKEAGYTNVTEYHEGIKGWVDGGNAVVEAKK